MEQVKRFAVALVEAVALCGTVWAAQMTPRGDAQVYVVQTPPSYNSWPMVQALGDRIVCATSNFYRKLTEKHYKKDSFRVSPTRTDANL